MKKLLIIPLIALAAGCGSQGATRTVTETAPAKTVTLPSAPIAPDDTQVRACQAAIDVLVDSGQSLSKATGIYIDQIKAAYLAGVTGGSIQPVLAKMDKATAIVNRATVKVKASQGEADACHS